jgi:transcriptional regulator with XRE-family HTH domain
MEKDLLKREVYRRLGQKIQIARAATNWTQAQLADFLELSRTSVTNIERGRQHIQLHILYRIAAALQISVHELLPEISAEEITGIVNLSAHIQTSPDQQLIAKFLQPQTRKRKPKIGHKAQP